MSLLVLDEQLSLQLEEAPPPPDAKAGADAGAGSSVHMGQADRIDGDDSAKVSTPSEARGVVVVR